MKIFLLSVIDSLLTLMVVSQFHSFSYRKIIYMKDCEVPKILALITLLLMDIVSFYFPLLLFTIFLHHIFYVNIILVFVVSIFVFSVRLFPNTQHVHIMWIYFILYAILFYGVLKGNIFI